MVTEIGTTEHLNGQVVVSIAYDDTTGQWVNAISNRALRVVNNGGRGDVTVLFHLADGTILSRTYVLPAGTTTARAQDIQRDTGYSGWTTPGLPDIVGMEVRS